MNFLLYDMFVSGVYSFLLDFLQGLIKLLWLHTVLLFECQEFYILGQVTDLNLFKRQNFMSLLKNGSGWLGAFVSYS
jgi:hypothetical protein